MTILGSSSAKEEDEEKTGIASRARRLMGRCWVEEREERKRKCGTKNKEFFRLAAGSIYADVLLSVVVLLSWVVWWKNR